MADSPNLERWPYSAIPTDLVIELEENLQRKEYNAIEMAKAQRKVRSILEQQSRQGFRSDLKDKQVHGREHLKDPHGISGALQNVFHESHYTIDKRKKVLEEYEAQPKRFQWILDLLVSGKITISRAHTLVSNDIKKQKIMSQAPRIEIPCDFLLYNRDFSKSSTSLMPPGSLDLIFTDPPYDRASLPAYEALARFSARSLKQGGMLVCYAGQYYLDKIINIFGKQVGLSYFWQGAVLMSGHNARIYRKRVHVCYKPLLIYLKGKERACDTYFTDLVIKTKAPSKVLHRCEQSMEEAEHFIKAFTYEGQLVCDPMLGTGTTGLAALKLKRKFIGIEKDKDTLDIAQTKIAHWISQEQ